MIDLKKTLVPLPINKYRKQVKEKKIFIFFYSKEEPIEVASRWLSNL